MRGDDQKAALDTSDAGGRWDRWLDGVGLGGTALIIVVGIAWALANLWTVGWSWGGAAEIVSLWSVLGVAGYRRRARWHRARRLHGKQS